MLQLLADHLQRPVKLEILACVVNHDFLGLDLGQGLDSGSHQWFSFWLNLDYKYDKN